MNDVSSLAARVAAQRAQTLAGLQSVKSAARDKARGLSDNLQDLTARLKEAEQAREVVSGHNFDLFPTPAPLAARMVELAEITPGDRVLEPSAGTGRIADAIRAAGCAPVCVEFGDSPARYLEGRGYNVTRGDFLEYSAPEFDAVIMNPPFSHLADIDHVKHAYNLTRAGGRVVAIMGESAFFNSCNKAREFRSWLAAIGGTSEQLPPGTFKQSGTGVNARLVIIDKA